ncbi:MAG: type 4a pilus biogenesis protein PilO [Deltaproteobacteria bacterium]|jgi:Tfp pilus assembly protein PilO|nr:type 4a pilus biogenesis protein PilO [Deltaproteobacteria bacterium]
MAKAQAQKAQKGPDFFSKIAKLTKGAKAGILFACMAAVAAAFYFLHYEPWSASVTRLDNEVKSLNEQVTAEQTNLNKHKAVEEYIQPVEFTHDYLKRFLTSEDEIPRLIQIISDLGSQAGARVTLFAPKPAVPKTDYAEIQFTMNLEGPFLNVIKFFYSLSQMDRLINITSVDMASVPAGDSRVVMLRVQCQGSTYRSMTPEEILAAAAK